MRLGRALLAVTGATLLLGVMVGAATAGRLEMTSATYRITFTRVRLESEFNPEINCPVTLEGSFHARTIPKVVSTLMGYITRAINGLCERGQATILRETLPWHTRYRSFSGTLPAISAVTLDVVAFSVRTKIIETPCLLRTTAASPLTMRLAREAGGALSTAELEGAIQTTCLDINRVSGSSNLISVPGVLTRVTLRLI